MDEWKMVNEWMDECLSISGVTLRREMKGRKWKRCKPFL